MPPRAITLVAMPPSGEVFIMRDGDGLWLVPPPGAGDWQPIDEETVARAVADHGFDLIEETFAGWEELDAERQRRAGVGLAAVEIDVERFDAADVRGVLRSLNRFRRHGEADRALRVASRLLEAPVVRGDDDLYASVLALLRQLVDERVSPPAAPDARVSPPTRPDAHLEAAIERLTLKA